MEIYKSEQGYVLVQSLAERSCGEGELDDKWRYGEAAVCSLKEGRRTIC